MSRERVKLADNGGIIRRRYFTKTLFRSNAAVHDYHTRLLTHTSRVHGNPDPTLACLDDRRIRFYGTLRFDPFGESVCASPFHPAMFALAFRV